MNVQVLFVFNFLQVMINRTIYERLPQSNRIDVVGGWAKIMRYYHIFSDCHFSDCPEQYKNDKFFFYLQSWIQVESS